MIVYLVYFGVMRTIFPLNCFCFLRHGGPPPKTMHQYGLTTGNKHAVPVNWLFLVLSSGDLLFTGRVVVANLSHLFVLQTWQGFICCYVCFGWSGAILQGSKAREIQQIFL